jgi:hypothetical protein
MSPASPTAASSVLMVLHDIHAQAEVGAQMIQLR